MEYLVLIHGIIAVFSVDACQLRELCLSLRSLASPNPASQGLEGPGPIPFPREAYDM